MMEHVVCESSTDPSGVTSAFDLWMCVLSTLIPIVVVHLRLC